MTDHPSGPNHRQVIQSFNWDPPRRRVTIPQSHVTETRVYSPVDKVLGGVSTLPLQPSGLSRVDVAALHMHHVTVKGNRLPGDDELAPHAWTNIPGEDGSVESIPVCKVFFLRDEVEFGGSCHYALRMVAFIVKPGPVPSVGYYIWVWTVFSTHFNSNIAYPVFPIYEKL